MPDVRNTAVDVTVSRPDSAVTIEWSDHHRSRYSFAYLRSRCPCAVCDTTKHGGPARSDAEMAESLHEGVGVDTVNEVGHYAIRFVWSDGHDSGIYAYEYLRSLCTCEECLNN